MADVLLESSDADGGVVKHVNGQGVGDLGAYPERDESKKAESEAVVAGVAGLYAMTLIGLGAVFPIAFFLSGERLHKGMYLSIFHIYVYSVALVFILYLYISIQRYKHTTRPATNNNKLTTTYKRMSELEENAAIAPLPDGNNRKSESDTEPSSLPPLPPPPPEVELLPDEIAVEVESGGQEGETRQLTACAGGQMPMVDYSGHGANFFLRMGLIAFGLGSAMLDAFRLLQFLEADIWKCYGVAFILNTALRLVFVLAQSFFLFKHHKVILNYNKSVMKFGLLHLVATNLVTWALTIVLEASGAFMHLSANSGEGAYFPAYNLTVVHHPVKVEVKPHDEKRTYTGGCYRSRTLADEAAPYLFPFVIEFSLLAAAILYRLYTNIGKCAIRWNDHGPSVSGHNTLTSAGKGTTGTTTTSLSDSEQGKQNTQCHKANSGLFPGLVVFTMVFVGMCFSLYYNSSHEAAASAPGGISWDRGFVPGKGLIHLLSDLSVNIISLLAIFPAFCYLRKLRFRNYLSSSLDQNLLVIALAGYYLLLGFMGVAAFSQMYEPFAQHFALMLGISCVLTFLQSTLQVCFIFDGLRRQVKNSAQAEQKPARSFITFLLICNLAMWIINSFELKEAHTARIFTEFYGGLGWTIIMHVCLPLAVYFRFHASVCLSDIWLHAYKLETVCLLTPAAARAKKK